MKDPNSYLKGNSKLYAEPEKMHAKNTKNYDVRRNEKIWSMGSIIEVSPSEAEHLHKEGFQVMDDQDLEDHLEAEAEKAAEVKKQSEVKEEGK